jgi:hypothetical protein
LFQKFPYRILKPYCPAESFSLCKFIHIAIHLCGLL